VSTLAQRNSLGNRRCHGETPVACRLDRGVHDDWEPPSQHTPLTSAGAAPVLLNGSTIQAAAAAATAIPISRKVPSCIHRVCWRRCLGSGCRGSLPLAAMLPRTRRIGEAATCCETHIAYLVTWSSLMSKAGNQSAASASDTWQRSEMRGDKHAIPRLHLPTAYHLSLNWLQLFNR
jgi:hypothetical protein